MKSEARGFAGTQVKFAASSELPVPVHFARVGNGQSGRVRVGDGGAENAEAGPSDRPATGAPGAPGPRPRPAGELTARMVFGATPFSTQPTTASNRPVGAGPTPPPQ